MLTGLRRGGEQPEIVLRGREGAQQTFSRLLITKIHVPGVPESSWIIQGWIVEMAPFDDIADFYSDWV